MKKTLCERSQEPGVRSGEKEAFHQPGAGSPASNTMYGRNNRKNTLSSTPRPLEVQTNSPLHLVHSTPFHATPSCPSQGRPNDPMRSNSRCLGQIEAIEFSLACFQCGVFESRVLGRRWITVVTAQTRAPPLPCKKK